MLSTLVCLSRFMLVLTVGLVLAPAAVWAQAAKATAEPSKIAAPEPVTMEAKDGFTVHGVYYKGDHGVKAIPVLCLHGWGGSQGDLQPFALKLQAAGHTVLTIDLRGHGKSTTYKDAKGEVQTLDAKEMKPLEIANAVFDIRAAKKFLVDRNNAKECNIEALCVLACDVTCILAMEWAVFDWSLPTLPSIKQGQDVKALVLLSPESSYKGLTNRNALQNVVIRKQLSVLVAAGDKDSKALAEARKLHTSLGQLREKVSPKAPAEERAKKTDLFLVPVDTELQGPKLLSRALPLADNIERFIELRLTAKLDEFTWGERRNPLGK